jgi:iron(III) transport system permease protein
MTPSAPALFRIAGRQLSWIMLTILVCVLILLPIVSLVHLALSDGASGVRQLLRDPRSLQILWNTLTLGAGAVVVALIAGSAVAFSVWSLPPSMRRYTSFIPVLPLLIPSVAHVIGFVFLFSPENGYINTALRSLPILSDLRTGPFNIYTAGGIITYTGLHLSAFVYLFVLTGLQEMGEEYAQAARVNGAGRIRTFYSITLPMLRPVFVYASMVVMLLALGQFSGPLMLGRREGIDVVTTEMYLVTREFPVNYQVGAAYGMPLLLVALILVWAQQKLIGNRDRFVGRGHTTAAPMPANRFMHLLAVVVIVCFAALSAVLPLAALIYVSVSPFWSGSISFSHLTMKHINVILSNPNVIASAITTLKLASISIAVTLPLGMLVSMAIFFRATLWRPLSVLLDAVASIPLAIPSALVGFGFLFAYASLPFGLYGSALGLVLAFVTIKLPFAVRYQLASLIALGPTQVEAALANGSSSVRTFFQIILPLARGGIAAAAAVIFVLLVHEFGVALMLRSTDSSVMSVVLFDLFNTGGLYPQVAAMAVLMTIITMVGVLIALWIGGTKAFERI